MSVRFPAIMPTDRRFKLAAWPTTSSRAYSGMTTRRRWGSEPSDAELQLDFRNIPDGRAADIAVSYWAAGGASEELILPDVLFHGADQKLVAIMRAQPLRWFFSESVGSPVITSVAPGLSTTAVVLVAELHYG